jgi:hypothetical protein
LLDDARLTAGNTPTGRLEPTMRAVATFLLVALCFASVSGARLRGQYGEQVPHLSAQSSQAAPEQNPLFSFLQQHQRAFEAQQHQQQQQVPSEQAQQAAQQTVPQGAAEAQSGDVLSALEHTPHALVQTGQAAKGPGEDGDGSDFGPCKTCVFVLERIKKGSNMLLPAICSELYHKYPDAYALCHQVLNALSINGNNVRYWLFEGCFKYEIYQSKEWIKPCPSHVMCSVLKDLSASPFCPALPMENPFADA